MPKMTEEHREFLTKLSNKTEGQAEHVAGCEACFNYYLFGEGYRCKDYPSRHRIKNSEFEAMLRRTTGGSIEEMTSEVAAMLRERFADELITETTLDEVTIVQDSEWKE